MDMTKEGNYKLEDWSLKDVECCDLEWAKNRPCHSKFTLYDGDIVKRYVYDDEVHYGFICDKCHLFNEINEKYIPADIKKFCPEVAAPGSDAYSKLSDEEKELSKYL